MAQPSQAMSNPAMTDAGPADETIRVICRIRPLNSIEEKAGSKFVLKFPSDETISCGVSIKYHKKSALTESV